MMKTLYILTLGAVLLAVPSMSRADKTFAIVGLNWNGSMDNPDCNSAGENCAISLTVIGISVTDDGQGNWLVWGGLNQPVLYIQGESAMGGQSAGFVFPQGSCFQILEGEYHGVPALSVNLSDVQADPQGRWSIWIPKQ